MGRVTLGIEWSDFVYDVSYHDTWLDAYEYMKREINGTGSKPDDVHIIFITIEESK